MRSHIQRALLTQSLALHVSEARARQILRQPELLRPMAHERELTIMFSDIEGFSTIAGRRNAGDLVAVLNGYFDVALECVFQTDGTVVKLIGDGIFAVWNAPLDQTGHQLRACRSVFALRERLEAFAAAQKAVHLRTRVGLHTGLAHVGNFGSQRRFDYTAIGESVNLASRLEGLNKHLGTQILATRDFQKGVEDEFVSRRMGDFRLKGFDRVVEVYELVGSTACTEATLPWRQSFEDGLRLFQNRQFEPAKSLFERTLELRPADGPARFYLEHLAELQHHPPSAGWMGEVLLSEK